MSARKIHLLDPKDESGNLILSLPALDMYVEFDSGSNAALTTKTDEELLSYDQKVFDSDAEVMIENAIANAPITTEAARIFKAQLEIMKAIIFDKSSTNDI